MIEWLFFFRTFLVPSLVSCELSIIELLLSQPKKSFAKKQRGSRPPLALAVLLSRRVTSNHCTWPGRWWEYPRNCCSRRRPVGWPGRDGRRRCGSEQPIRRRLATVNTDTSTDTGYKLYCSDFRLSIIIYPSHQDSSSLFSK